jgi:hypothetical protein
MVQRVSAGDIAIAMSDDEWDIRQFEELHEEIMYQLPDGVREAYVASMVEAVRRYQASKQAANRAAAVSMLYNAQ